MSTEIVYSDIDLNLSKTQYSDFEFKTNIDSIYQSMHTILQTKKGDRTRFLNPYFGSNLYKLLFEKMSIFTVLQIQGEVKSALDVWEPRIEVTDVLVAANYENLTYDIDIFFTIIDIGISDVLTLEFAVYK